MNISLDTPLSQLTVRDLLGIIAQNSDTPGSVRGIEGIALIFDVSISTAKRIKASGIIDKAVSQKGRVIVTDVAQARRLWAESAHGRRQNTFKSLTH